MLEKEASVQNKFEYSSARELEIVIVSVCLRQAAELSTLIRPNVQGQKRLYFDTAEEN